MNRTPIDNIERAIGEALDLIGLVLGIVWCVFIAFAAWLFVVALVIAVNIWRLALAALAIVILAAIINPQGVANWFAPLLKGLQP